MKEFMPDDILVLRQLNEEQVSDIENLERKVFASTYEPGHFRGAFEKKKKPLYLLVYVHSELVAFKAGHEEDAKTFYSWVGGVHPSYRRLGLAKLLMDRQHAELRKMGYRIVTTKTRESYKAMLLLNQKEGFELEKKVTKPGVEEEILVLRKEL